MQKNFYISTAISYPNGPPHIGHAYEVMATDAIARFRRLSGDRVYFPPARMTTDRKCSKQRAIRAKQRARWPMN